MVYLTHTWGEVIRGFRTFLKGISPKENAVAWLEFELVDYKFTVKHISHYTTERLSLIKNGFIIVWVLERSQNDQKNEDKRKRDTHKNNIFLKALSHLFRKQQVFQTRKKDIKMCEVVFFVNDGKVFIFQQQQQQHHHHHLHSLAPNNRLHFTLICYSLIHNLQKFCLTASSL